MLFQHPQQQNQQQQQQQPLELIRFRIQQAAKFLVEIEEWSERLVLKTFRLATHPIVLLDIAILIVWANIMTVWSGGSGVVVLAATTTTTTIASRGRSVLRGVTRMGFARNSKRQWLRLVSRAMTGSARRWTQFVRGVIQQQRQLLPMVRNLVKSLRKIVTALWEHRSRYSLLSDYAWYVNTCATNSSGSSSTALEEPIQQHLAAIS
jgi:hypothetical protein